MRYIPTTIHAAASLSPAALLYLAADHAALDPTGPNAILAAADQRGVGRHLADYAAWKACQIASRRHPTAEVDQTGGPTAAWGRWQHWGSPEKVDTVSLIADLSVT